jgi:hypothetical protein
MIQWLAVGNDPIVTTRASAQHLEVIDLQHRFPQVSVMTIFTNIGGADVVKPLAKSSDIVMTTDAATGDVLVVNISRLPGRA